MKLVKISMTKFSKKNIKMIFDFLKFLFLKELNSNKTIMLLRIKRERDQGEENSEETLNLKIQSLKLIFYGLPQQKQHKLLSELLDESKFLYGKQVDNIDPNFINWLYSGTELIYKQNEVYEFWMLWNFLRERSAKAWADKSIEIILYSYAEFIADTDNFDGYHLPDHIGKSTSDPKNYFVDVLNLTLPKNLFIYISENENCPFLEFFQRRYTLEKLIEIGWTEIRYEN